MANFPTPTIRDITRKLKQKGFKKTHAEALLTKLKPSPYSREKAKRSLPQLALKEPKAPYGKKK